MASPSEDIQYPITAAEAQKIHDLAQGIANDSFHLTGREPAQPHFGGCWCCCDDCGFDFTKVTLTENGG